MASSYGQSSIAEKLPCMSYFLDMKRQRQGQRDYSETSVSKGSSGTSHSIGNDINQFNIGDKGEIRSDYYEFNFNIRNADAYKEQNKNDNELQPHIACGRNCGSCNVHRYECNLQSGPNIYNINLTLGNNTNYPSAITDRMPRDQEKYTQENPWQELKGQGNAMRISEELTKGMERQERYEMPTYEEPIQSGTFIEDQLTRFEDNQEYQTYHLDLDSMLDQNQTEINWNLMAAHDSSFQPSSSPTSSGYMTYSQDSGCTNSNYSSSEENDASPMPSSNYVPMANNISNYDNCRQLCQLIDMGQTDVKYHQVHKSVSEPGKIRQEGEISGELVYAELNNCRPSSQQMSPGSCMIWPQVPDNVHYYNNTPPSGTAQDVRMTHVGGLSSVHSHSNDLSNSSSESSCGYSNNNSPNDSGGSTRHYNEVHTLYADMDPENDLMSSNRTYGNGTESTSSGTGSDGISSGRDDDEIGEDENMKEDVQKTSSKHRKTDLSYIALISKAILSTPEKRMLLPEIYTYLSTHFKDTKRNQRPWKNSVRYNLSVNECFMKQERHGRGHYWLIHPACIDDFMKGDFRRRQARRRAKKSFLYSVDMQVNGSGSNNLNFPTTVSHSEYPPSHSQEIYHRPMDRQTTTYQDGIIPVSQWYSTMCDVTPASKPRPVCDFSTIIL